MPLLKRCFTRWVTIISVLMLALMLGGCSAVRLSYNNAPSLAYWWLDDYFDFDKLQSQRLRADLQALQDWHRAQELPLFRELLKNLQTAAAQPVTPEQVCSLYPYLRNRVQLSGERLAPTLAAIAPTLSNAQMEHMARRLEKRRLQWREEWMDDTPVHIAERRAKQLVERTEWFYGRLDATQLALVRSQLGAVEFDSAMEFGESLRRHQDTLHTFEQLRGAGAAQTQAQAQDEIRALVARSLNSPESTHQQYQAKIRVQSCAVVATLHNSTRPEQRQKLAQTLQAYENDVRALEQP